MSAPAKRFRLAMVNAAEDVPRLIRAYGKACGGEFGMVLRPLEGRGVLVHVAKDGTRVWRGASRPADGRESAPAEVRQTDRGLRLVATGGPQKGIEWVPYDHAALMAGKEVTIAFYRDDQFAHVVNEVVTDAPMPPTELIDAKAGIALLKKAQERIERETPITLRGHWSGYLYCDDGIPRVELVRKIAAYGTLTITSDRGRWKWSIERGERWFTRPTTESGHQNTLVEAVEHGLGVTMSVLGEACSFRDVHRRAAGDPAWGATHPIKPAKEGKDPTERLRERKPKRAADPAPVAKTEPPPTAEAAAEAAVVASEAADLGAAEPDGFAWVDPPSQHDLATWFFVNLLPSVGDAIVSYDGGADRPLGSFLEGLAVEVDGAGFDPGKAAEAHQALDRVREALTAAPKLMERARRLIGRAHALARSGHCSGEDRAQALRAVARAEAAYEEARSAIVAGESVDGVQTLKRIGTEVALAAAKAARACARGQKQLIPEPEAPTPAKTPKLRVVDTKPRTARAVIDRLLSETTTLKRGRSREAQNAWVEAAMNLLGIVGTISWKRRGLHVLATGTAADQPLGAILVEAGTQVTLPIEIQWQKPKPAGRKKAPKAEPSPASTETADEAKDKALMDAFGKALGQALDARTEGSE